MTPAVLHEADVALTAHELIKVRVFADDRAEREALLAHACAALDCAPVQQIGKLLVLWRPRPQETTTGRKPVPPRKPMRLTTPVAQSAPAPKRRPAGKAPSGVPRAASPRRRRRTS